MIRPGQKTRVAILGGGTGALTTAYFLSNSAPKRAKFDVTIYQTGWRLGGKGASARDPEARGRNIEHGLHVFAGFYDNAFEMLHDCYAEWSKFSDRQFGIGEAFIGHDNATLESHSSDGWHHLPVDLPIGPGRPGLYPEKLTPGEMVLRILTMLVRRGISLLGPDWDETSDDKPGGALFLIKQAMKLLRSFIGDHVGKFEPPDLLWFPPARELLCRTLKQLLRVVLAAQSRMGRPKDSNEDPMIAAVAIVVAIGVIEDRLFEQGFEAADNEELASWLRRHGANDRLIDSPYIRGGYDYAFAYADGQSEPVAQRSIAAGVALRAFIRQHFTYHGSFFYHLNGGMGEVVFTPLYEVLHSWGVAFSFFHRVDSLHLTADGKSVLSVEGIRQAEVVGAQYDPLIDWNKRGVWPRRPLYDQLRDGDQLAAWDDDLESAFAPDRGRPRFTLQHGQDFDELVLAIPIQALDGIADELCAAHPRWRTAVDTAKSIPTVSAQLWLSAPKEKLGWKQQPDLVTAYAQPFNTWADMTYLLGGEEASSAKQLSYLCGPWPSAAAVDDQSAQQSASKRLAEWLDENAGHIMPSSIDPHTGRFDVGLIVDSYVRAHINPSDRYVLSPPNSIKYRIPSADTGLTNLCVAGDWTRNGLDVGCFEAAVMSGKQCARRISGEPIPVYGESKSQL